MGSGEASLISPFWRMQILDPSEHFFTIKSDIREFPHGAVDENPPASAGVMVQSLVKKIPHALVQLSSCAATTEPML